MDAKSPFTMKSRYCLRAMPTFMLKSTYCVQAKPTFSTETCHCLRTMPTFGFKRTYCLRAMPPPEFKCGFCLLAEVLLVVYPLTNDCLSTCERLSEDLRAIVPIHPSHCLTPSLAGHLPLEFHFSKKAPPSNDGRAFIYHCRSAYAKVGTTWAIRMSTSKPRIA